MLMLSLNKRSIKTFQERLKTAQYNTALAITGALRVPFRRWFRKQCLALFTRIITPKQQML